MKINGIKYIQGNLFDHQPTEGRRSMITHVCNDKGGWGKGFVIPLAKFMPESKEQYQSWHNLGVDGRGVPFQRGQTQFVKGENGFCVANMVAQTLGTKRPLFYDSLVFCMSKVAQEIEHNKSRWGEDYEIIAPLFGSALAGGNWDFIEELIVDIWSDIDVTVYYLDRSHLTERLQNLLPPPYMARPDDHQLFVYLPEYGCYQTYPIKKTVSGEDSLPHTTHTYDLLKRHNFIPVQENELSRYEKS